MRGGFIANGDTKARLTYRKSGKKKSFRIPVLYSAKTAASAESIVRAVMDFVANANARRAPGKVRIPDSRRKSSPRTVGKWTPHGKVVRMNDYIDKILKSKGPRTGQKTAGKRLNVAGGT